MRINIQRVERVMNTNETQLIEKHTFNNWGDAFAWLRDCGLPIAPEHEEAIKGHETTTTNAFMEMINRGNAAYSGRVFYHIEHDGEVSV